MNNKKRSKINRNKKQWNKLFDYEIVYHFNRDVIPQSRYYKTDSSDKAFTCFKISMKNRLDELFIDEFTKLNPYSNQKELLDIPSIIL